MTTEKQQWRVLAKALRRARKSGNPLRLLTHTGKPVHLRARALRTVYRPIAVYYYDEGTT